MLLRIGNIFCIGTIVANIISGAVSGRVDEEAKLCEHELPMMEQMQQ